MRKLIQKFYYNFFPGVGPNITFYDKPVCQTLGRAAVVFVSNFLVSCLLAGNNIMGINY